MIIFKPSKILLWEKIKKNSEYLFGVILDAGSGGVDRYSKAFPKMKKIITLDINEKNNPDIVASIDKIPLENEFVDSIICTQVIGDVVDFKKAIKEFKRVLKPEGIIMLSESFMNEIHGEPYDYWRFTKYGLERLFKEQNFEIVKLEQLGGFFSVIAQFKIRYLIDRFDLYESRILNLLFAPFLKIYGKFMLSLDKLDKSKTNNKYAIGWLIIAKKKKL